MELKLPFYIRTIGLGENYDFPVKLSFHLFQDEIGLIRQKGNAKLNELLNRAYTTGSLFEGSLSNETGNIYFHEFKDFISTHARKKGKLLEIGCGKGNLLRSIADTYESAVGIEPGVDPIKTSNYELLSGFFPRDLSFEQFDLIIHFGVLEHIEDPYSFLEDNRSYLSDDGVLVFAVPDCSESLECGDISILFHEHFSYFSRETLNSLLIQCGFEVQSIHKFQGMLFIAARHTNKGKNFTSQGNNFQNLIEKKMKNLEECLKGFNDTDVAIYPCLKGINYMSIMNKYDVRLVDDSSELVGRIVPGFTRTIESFEELVKNPPRFILVTSRTFQEVIAQRISKEDSLKGCQVEFL